MTKRFAVVFTSLAILLVAGCDNASDRARQAAQVPPQAPSMPPPTEASAPPPAIQAPAPQDDMAKPPGTDPVKLAEHAKALQELGYQEEAAKLYGHACHWGYAPACAQLQAQGNQMAQQPSPPAHAGATQAKPAATATAKPTKPAPTPAVAMMAPATPAKPAASPAMPPAAPPPAPTQMMAQSTPVAPVAAPSSPPPQAAPIVQAAAKPMSLPAPPAKPAVVDTRKLSQQAHGLEDIGYVPVAVTLYRDACFAGDGLSCKRLGEIYIKGIDGVKRDYAESVRWYDRARKLGIDVPALEKRAVYR